MKKIIIALVLLITVNLLAEKYAGEIFNMSISPRNSALGGCGLTDDDTFSPAYWNSALLTEISNNKYELMHAEEYSGLLKFDTFSGIFGTIEKVFAIPFLVLSTIAFFFIS